MNQRKNNFNNPKPVLAFDSEFKLVAMFDSIISAERVTKLPRQKIHDAMYDKVPAYGGLYWREIDKDFILESDDLGKLNMLNYDSDMGVDHAVYCTPKMKHGNLVLESKLSGWEEYIKTSEYKEWRKKRAGILWKLNHKGDR